MKNISKLQEMNPKDSACKQLYLERMRKLQMKLDEVGVADLIGSSVVPQQYIDVGWGGKDSENVMLFGNVLALSKCLEKPTVLFEGQDNIFYTVMGFDMDYPDGPYLLWCRMNMTGDMRFASGRDIFRWQPVRPRPNMVHRVFVIVFHQRDGQIALENLPIISKNSKQGRSGFNIQDFRSKHGLENIIGMNACRMPFDATSVSLIEAQLREKILLDADGKVILGEEIDGQWHDYSKKM